jgi:hypothetical protein
MLDIVSREFRSSRREESKRPREWLLEFFMVQTKQERVGSTGDRQRLTRKGGRVVGNGGVNMSELLEGYNSEGSRSILDYRGAGFDPVP